MFTERSEQKFRIWWILTLRLKICENFDDSMKVYFVGEKYEIAQTLIKCQKYVFWKNMFFFPES